MRYTCVCGFATDDVDVYIKHQRFCEVLFGVKWDKMHAHMDAIKERVRLERESTSASTRKTYWLNEVPNWANKTGRKESQTEITEEEYNAFYEEWGGTYDPEVHCYNTDGTDNVSQYISVHHVW